MNADSKRQFIIYTTISCLAWSCVVSLLLAWQVSSQKKYVSELAVNQGRFLSRQVVASARWDMEHRSPIALSNEVDSLAQNYHGDKQATIFALSSHSLIAAASSSAASPWGGQSFLPSTVHFHYSEQADPETEYPLDDWEAGSINTFAAGSAREAMRWRQNEQRENRFDYIAPLMLEQGCLSCHDDKGIGINEVYGGVSISMSADPLLALSKGETRDIVTSFTLIWLIGMVGILAGLWNIRKTIEERVKMEKFQGVLEMAGTAAHEMNQPLQVICSYTEILDILGYQDLDRFREIIKQMRLSTARMASVTRKITQITRYETMPYTSNKMIIDLDKAAAVDRLN